MTLYFPDFVSSNKISFNGDYSGYETYYLLLKSRYTNRVIGTTTFLPFLWAPELVLSTSNERYTEFTFTDFAFNIAGQITSGYYNYELLGSLLVLNNQVDEFNINDWTILQDGLCKVKSQRSNDMNLNLTSETVRYQSPNEDAQSYVIYTP